MRRLSAFFLPGLLLVLLLFSLPASAAPLDPIYPADGANDVAPGPLSLRWERDPDALSYQVTFGTSAATMAPVSLANSTIPIADVTTEKGTTYYWQVSAVSGDVVTPSNIWSFSTRATPSPGLERVYPTGAADEKVPFGKATLQWTVKDEEGRALQGLLFDVYLGESAETLSLVWWNLRDPLCDVALASSKKYFWYVRAHDSEGNETFSPIWTFETSYDDSISGGCALMTPHGVTALLLPLLLLLRR